MASPWRDLDPREKTRAEPLLIAPSLLLDEIDVRGSYGEPALQLVSAPLSSRHLFLEARVRQHRIGSRELSRRSARALFRSTTEV